jgi:hypothetical protein
LHVTDGFQKKKIKKLSKRAFFLAFGILLWYNYYCNEV